MKKFVLFTLILFLIFSLCSCTDTRSCEEILFSITNEKSSLPYGNLYLKSAEEGDVAHIPDSTLTTLYHEGVLEYEFTLIEDFAIYLCPKAPCEIAVFRCYSATDTELIAAMCLKRIDMLNVLLEETPYKDIPKNAKIQIKGKVVSVVMA